MSGPERLALMVNMPALRAKRHLERHGAATADDLYDLVLAATGSEEAAQKAFNDRRTAELRSGRPVPTG